MGSSNSRLGSRPSRLNRTMKRGFSSLICGSSSSHAPVHETDDYPAELLEGSAQGHNSIILNEVQSSTKEETSTFSAVNESPRSTVDALSNSSNTSELSTEYRRRCFEISNDGKSLSESKELVQDVSGDGYSPLEPYSQRNADMGSTSHTERQSPPSVCDAVEEMCSSSRSHQEPESSCLDRALPAGYLPNDVLGIRSPGMSSVPIVSNSSILTSHPLRDDAAQEVNASGPGLLMLDSQRDRSGSVLHVDVVSISSGSLFSGTREVSNREVRRNSRRLFWDAISRRNSRRHSDSRTIFFSGEGIDDLGSQDRWLLDFSGDLFEDGIGSDSGYLGNRSHGMYEGRWHSRSEIWNRFRGFDESTRQTTFCASGLHPDGTCSCESFLTAEESGSRGSISRIVILAEALFEVLDEIHRQPASFAHSTVSVPAPESIVNSFPLRSCKRHNTAENGDDAEQCDICLAEYEEGDKIRVLPCHHEYHMACVDKWLKEIHGVCPLCRGDVCVGAAEGSIANSG